MNCIAIDDEKLALNKIKRYVDKIQYLNLIETFENAIDSIHFLKENEVHLIFLDIEMDELNGIEFLESINNIPYVIITSAYKTYALKSFEFNVIDYILKPIEFSRFVKAVEKVYSNFQKDVKLKEPNNISINLNDNDKEEFLFLKEGRKMNKVSTSDILYIKGMKDYLRIYTRNSKLMILSNFSSLLNKLPSDNFIRVHRSYIVSLNKIDFLENNKIGIGEKIIPVGISYKMEFNKRYESYCK
jgi:DNA-binding LytR/AlgR family response regulator